MLQRNARLPLYSKKRYLQYSTCATSLWDDLDASPPAGNGLLWDHNSIRYSLDTHNRAPPQECPAADMKVRNEEHVQHSTRAAGRPLPDSLDSCPGPAEARSARPGVLGGYLINPTPQLGAWKSVGKEQG